MGGIKGKNYKSKRSKRLLVEKLYIKLSGQHISRQTQIKFALDAALLDLDMRIQKTHGRQIERRNEVNSFEQAS